MCISTHVFACMVYSADIVRHGARAPIQALKGSYRWPESEGELLPVGFQELYQRGEKAKKRLVSACLLPVKNNAGVHLNQLLRVDSSDFDRTLMSAEAFTEGLYPMSKMAAAIPIHTMPQGEDTLLMGFVPWHKKEMLLLSHADKQLDVLLNQATRACPAQLMHANVLKGLFSAEDALIMRHLGKRPYPAWIPSECQREMIDIFNRTWSDLYSDRVMAIQVTSHLLGLIREEARLASLGKSKMRYHLFVGHDDDIAAVMSAFGQPLTVHPPIASVISFEFYQISNDAPLTVSMRFNGQPIKWPICKSPCPVSLIWPEPQPSLVPKTQSPPNSSKHR